ncbi:hypothetical protein EN780_03205 [Mesorhizobium sp. M4B.F.Ca.ET.089.01.1.1]|uniref:GIY-YIG nuclease family protein n=1 Tax=Mesorhizobium sp. M4B.F.Ca.ET.089.01.1.1 TaxID=2496662 RepID=UPI000FE39D74|nr:GIY-YIG nuclease family protein [Mesorhizobium sp. M4B.F.Ca.ET.089.01.1.1]RWX70415.1 hypothetical protein EN780_03205 [Mesorhizobium sp. M4B.F.Ca.ET.089.01.1.1]
MTIGIYSILNLVDGKRYIGKSIDIERRWDQHRKGQTNRHLHNAFKKYGLASFRVEILEQFEVVDEHALAERELAAMDIYKTCDRRFGYNLRRDSSSGMIVHEESRARMSLSHLLREPPSQEARDKHLAAMSSPATRAKISAGHRGKKRSAEHRANLGKANSKRRPPSPETRGKLATAARLSAGNRGKRHSPDAIAKMSIAAKQRRARSKAMTIWMTAP